MSTLLAEDVQAGDLGRARWRDRQARKTGVTGVIVQGLSQAIRLVVIPLSIKMLGVEQYGIWLVVGSLVAWGGVTDLGLAPGLINVIATAQGRGDRQGVRRAISTAIAAYGALAIIIVGLAIVLSQWSGLPRLLGARTPEMVENGRMLVLVCGSIFAATTLTRVVNTTTTAMQEGYLGLFSFLAGSVASLALLISVATVGSKGLLSYALVVTLPPLFAQLGLALYVYGWRHRDLRPGWRWVDRASLQTLWGFAGPLTVYQIANLGVLYSANVLIANRLGAAMVPQYSVPYAAFAVFITAASLIVTPYTPAIAEAKVRGDWEWIRRRTQQVILASVGLFATGGLVIAAIGRPAIDWWTSSAVVPPIGLLLALLFFGVFRVAGSTINEVLTGLGLVRFAAGAFVVVSALYVIASWLALPAFGLVVLPLASGAAHVVYVTVSAIVAFSAINRGRATAAA
ncbi:MAG: lipopolysaccharide biosynthesis protein [Bryobacteraceae bacterium]